MSNVKRMMLSAIITTNIYLARAEAHRRGVDVGVVLREWRSEN